MPLTMAEVSNGFDDCRGSVDGLLWLPTGSMPGCSCSGALPPIGEEPPATEWAAQVSSEIAEMAKRHAGTNSGGKHTNTDRKEEELDVFDSQQRSEELQNGLAKNSVDVSEFQELLHLISNLVRQIQKVESDLHAHLETQLQSLQYQEDDERRKLARRIADALDMEKRLREEEMRPLQEALARPRDHKEPLEVDAEWISTAAKQEWESLSDNLMKLRRRVLEDISERHAQVALDIAERHLEVSRTFDARTGELAELQARVTGNILAEQARAEHSQQQRQQQQQQVSQVYAPAASQRLLRPARPPRDDTSTRSSVASCESLSMDRVAHERRTAAGTTALPVW